MCKISTAANNGVVQQMPHEISRNSFSNTGTVGNTTHTWIVKKKQEIAIEYVKWNNKRKWATEICLRGNIIMLVIMMIDDSA